MVQEPALPPRGEGIGQGALESACFLVLWSRLLQDGRFAHREVAFYTGL